MFVDQNGISCFIDENGLSLFIDENGILLTCDGAAPTATDSAVLLGQICL